MTRPRVAIAHDYLTQRGGAERVVLSMLRAFPEATVHTTFYDPDGTFPEFRDARIVTSPLNRSRFLRADPRRALPLLRRTASRLHVEADVVVVSTSGWAHGFDIHGKRLVYCHAPARWLHQRREYLDGPTWASPQGWALGVLRAGLLRWDAAAAARADRYLCNSRVVRGRVWADYGIAADVLAPPYGVLAAGPQEAIPGAGDWVGDPADDGADAPAAAPSDGRGDYLLVVARLVAYKHVREAIEAVRGTQHRLLVIGHGPERRALDKHLPDNVRIFEQVPDAQLRWAYAHSRALLAASYEDFGLTPLEAAGHGKPTIALRAGGYLDTVHEDVTGLYFDSPTVPAIRAAIEEEATRTWDPAAIRAHAALFSEERFIDRLRREVAALTDGPGARTPQQVG